MAKVAISKLGLKINQEVKTFEFNGQNIEVKQYLPIQDRLRLISNVINQALEEDSNFANPVKVRMFLVLEILDYYTNINITEKMKEDPTKLYDIIKSSRMFEEILSALPEDEYLRLETETLTSLRAFYEYKNSAVGILDALKTGYEQQTFDVQSIVEQIKDPEALAILKEIAPLMD